MLWSRCSVQLPFVLTRYAEHHLQSGRIRGGGLEVARKTVLNNDATILHERGLSAASTRTWPRCRRRRPPSTTQGGT